MLLGDGQFRFRIVGTKRHRAALGELSAGRKLRCAALLTPEGGDYDPESVTITIRDREVGFLPWMDGRDFRRNLRQAGFAEAVCGAEPIDHGRLCERALGELSSYSCRSIAGPSLIQDYVAINLKAVWDVGERCMIWLSSLDWLLTLTTAVDNPAGRRRAIDRTRPGD